MISLLKFGPQPRPLYCLGWRDSFNVSHECAAHVPDTWQCATCGRQEAESRARAHKRALKAAEKRRDEERKLAMAKREKRKFWYADSFHGRVVEVEGWSCDGTPDYWWCPSVGFSMSFGSSLFDTRDEAVARVKEMLRDEREQINRKLSALK